MKDFCPSKDRIKKNEKASYRLGEDIHSIYKQQRAQFRNAERTTSQ